MRGDLTIPGLDRHIMEGPQQGRVCTVEVSCPEGCTGVFETEATHDMGTIVLDDETCQTCGAELDVVR
jgi:hypothetical protein